MVQSQARRPVVSTDDLRTRYDTKQVLDRIDLTKQVQEIVAVPDWCRAPELQ